MNEGYVYGRLLDKVKKPKFQVNDQLRFADLRKTFSKGDSTNWSYKLYEITESIKDTTPRCHVGDERASSRSGNKQPEHSSEATLKKSTLMLKENNDRKETLNLK